MESIVVSDVYDCVAAECCERDCLVGMSGVSLALMHICSGGGHPSRMIDLVEGSSCCKPSIRGIPIVLNDPNSKQVVKVASCHCILESA